MGDLEGFVAAAPTIPGPISGNGDQPPGSPFPTRFHDRVAIVGFAEGTRGLVPFDRDDTEFWGLNRLHTVVPDGRWHRYFQLHAYDEHHGEDDEHTRWLKAQQMPVYLRPDDTHLGFGEPFPVDAVLRRFSPYAGGRYFTNSISWLIGLAICMEFKHIAVYGVDMAADTVLNAEYSMQRPSCEYFLGVAEGLGIEVEIPAGSDLLKATHLYGVEDPAPLFRKNLARLQELAQMKQQAKNELAQAQNAAAQLTARVQTLDGAMGQCEYMHRNWQTPLGGDA